MTRKERAKGLVDKFINDTKCPCYSHAELDAAKNCAALAIDFMLDEIGAYSEWNKEQIAVYEDIKREISLL